MMQTLNPRQLARMTRIAAVCSYLLALLVVVDSQGQIQPDPTYVVVTPTKIRPNQDVVVAATILRLELSNTFTIRAVVRYLVGAMRAEEICSAEYTFTGTGTQNIIMRTPPSMKHGNYTIRISGFSDPSLMGLIFSNETKVFFDSKQISVFIFTAKPWYSQKQTVRMRIIPLTTSLKPVTTAMDIRMINANGLVLKEWYSVHTNTGGVVSLAYPLSKQFVIYGTWTISVTCMGHVYNKTFEVEEYYAPLFHTRVVTPNYMYQSSKALTGKVDSWWINTLPVKGNATIQVDFLHGDDKRVTDVEPLRRPIHYFTGSAKFAIPREELAAHIGSENALVGKQLKVTVFILDWRWMKTYNGYDSTRVFSDEVLLKFLGGRVWTFKPNAPFKIYIAAQKADQSRVMAKASEFEHMVEVSVTRKDRDAVEQTNTEFVKIPKSSIIEYWLKPNTQTERISVKATYGGRIDTTQTLVATRHWSPNDHYLQITSTTSKPKVGQYIIFNIQTNTYIEYIHYYIVSSGNIITSDKLDMHSRNKLLSIAISREMSPSAKIVAFYIAPDGQVAADSLQFHVDATGLHKMKFGIGRGKDLSSAAVKIGLKTKPLSYVGVSFTRIEIYNMGGINSFNWPEVNRELYTFDNHANKTITHYWKKQGQVVDTFHAPTPSFAHDANSTFFYSGLYIFSDANVSSVYTECNRSKGEFPCMDGKTCYNYKQICDYSTSCTRDHRDEMGCKREIIPGQLEDSPELPLNDDRNLWRSKHIFAYQNDVAFGWTDKYTKQSGGNAITIKASPIGIKWVLTGFALNKDHGLAIPEPIIQPLKMWIFLIVKAQDKLRLGEILSLRVLITNKWKEPVDALISIPASNKYKFVQVERDEASQTQAVDGEQQILVSVPEGGKRQIYIPIEPQMAGSLSVPVKLLSTLGGHSKTHKVTVGYDGIKDANITSYQVDLRIANSERLPDMWISVTEDAQIYEQPGFNHVPGSPKSTVTVMGDIVGISFLPKAKYNLNTNNVIGKPSYSGHEATFNFAVNLYVTKMIKTLGTLSKYKKTAIAENLNTAMQEMLSYLQKDGSFFEFRWSFRSSTWLSATALEVMADGVKLRDFGDKFQMPSLVLKKTSKWLVKQQDKYTGRFIEAGQIHNRMYASKTDVEINGKVVPGNLALTALAVISLQKAAKVKSLSEDVVEAVKLGADYLSKHYMATEDPLEMAITTYALFTAGKEIAQQAMVKLKSMNRTVDNMVYWSTEEIPAIKMEPNGLDTTLRLLPKKGSSVGAYTITATSYALMAYLDNGDSKPDLDSIQKFLQEQHLNVGGFYSSHDTLRAMTALIKLAEKDQDRDTYDMTFTFTSDQSETWVKTIHLNQDNWFDVQQFNTPSHWGSIQTQVRGHGIALVQLRTTKNVDDDRAQLKQPPIKGIIDLGDFNYDITTSGFNHSFIHYKICPKWNGESEQSGMVVLEIALPSGYKASNWGSQKLVEQRRETTSLRAAQHLNGLEVFYFDYINKSRLNCVEFTSYRTYPVSNMAELTKIKIYEYYEPANFLLTYYEKIELVKLTVCLVCGSYQCPYCPFYNTAHVILPSGYIITLTSILLLFVNNRL